MTISAGKTARFEGQRGLSLIETMVAAVVLLIGFVATMSLFTVAVVQNSAQGDEGTRVTEYAQDKMEQLMALGFSDGATNTTVYPPASSGGTGLGGTMAGSATVGSVNPASPSTGYVDYLNRSGALLTTSTGAFYDREWSITTNAGANLKTITVYVWIASLPRDQGPPPTATLVCIKSE